MNPYKTKQFLALKRDWYSKLKANGFDDAEYDNGLLKECHSFRFNTERPRAQQSKISCQNEIRGFELQIQQRAEYFRMAGVFLHSHCFESDTEREIWRLHCDGVSMRVISEVVGKSTPMYTDKVKVTIHRLRNRMMHK